jgi:hypothetical protein
LNPNSADVNSLELRLAKLERQYCRWRAVALVCAILLAAAILVAARPVDMPMPNVVRARSLEAQTFILRDSNGEIRARLALSNGKDPRLTFYDEEGNVIATAPPAHGFQPLEVGPGGR